MFWQCFIGVLCVFLSFFLSFFNLCVCVEKQKAELTQQHTEWVRQVTQRHMKQIEDLQNELKTHTEMMALQQVKSTNHSKTTPK